MSRTSLHKFVLFIYVSDMLCTQRRWLLFLSPSRIRALHEMSRGCCCDLRPSWSPPVCLCHCTSDHLAVNVESTAIFSPRQALISAVSPWGLDHNGPFWVRTTVNYSDCIIFRLSVSFCSEWKHYGRRILKHAMSFAPLSEALDSMLYPGISPGNNKPLFRKISKYSFSLSKFTRPQFYFVTPVPINHSGEHWVWSELPSYKRWFNVNSSFHKWMWSRV